jgi:O-acetyl-ADP-ribose deacetylase (regulator of RNase III)
MIRGELAGIRTVVGDATHPIGVDGGPCPGPAILVHVCNDLGRWGKGFVVAISKRWPEPERAYRAWHARKEPPFELGAVQFVPVEPGLWVANLIGQHGLGTRKGVPPIRYPALRTGLATVAQRASDLGATVHMPRIGCGLAGGHWEEVSGLVEEQLVTRGISVTVYDLPS